jgi:hypothetical protein
LIAAALVIALLAGTGQGIPPWHQATNPRLLIGFGSGMHLDGFLLRMKNPNLLRFVPKISVFLCSILQKDQTRLFLCEPYLPEFDCY